MEPPQQQPQDLNNQIEYNNQQQESLSTGSSTKDSGDNLYDQKQIPLNEQQQQQQTNNDTQNDEKNKNIKEININIQNINTDCSSENLDFQKQQIHNKQLNIITKKNKNIYESTNYYNALFLKFARWVQLSPMENISIIFGLSALFHIISYYIPIHILTSIGIVFISIILVIYAKLKKWQKTAPLTQFSQETQDLFLEKSLFDLMCDFWYFPGIMRYIKAISSPLWTGAPPEESIHNFDDLSPTFKHKVLRKGIIHLFPESVKKFLLPDYETVLQQQWEKGQKQIMSKQQKEKNLNGEDIKKNIQKNMKFNMKLLKQEVQYKELQKKIDRDEEIKEYYQSDIVYQMKKSHEEKISWSNSQLKTIMKFLSGSHHVTQHDRKTLLRVFLGSSLVIMAFLYRKQKSRKMPCALSCTESDDNKGLQKDLLCFGFYSCFILYILFLIITFIYELASKDNMCSKEKGILVIFGGIIPAGLLIFLGYMQTKEMRSIIDDIVQDNPSVSMDEIVSKESQIDHLWELIVVYAIAKFMSLMVVIYFWVETDQTTGNYDCFYIPKDRLKKQPNYFLLEILLSLSIRFITIYLPLIYTIRLFWAKKVTKKSSTSNSIISFNDDSNLQYGNFQYGTNKANRQKNKSSALMDNISLTELNFSNESNETSLYKSKLKNN